MSCKCKLRVAEDIVERLRVFSANVEQEFWKEIEDEFDVILDEIISDYEDPIED